MVVVKVAAATYVTLFYIAYGRVTNNLCYIYIYTLLSFSKRN